MSTGVVQGNRGTEVGRLCCRTGEVPGYRCTGVVQGYRNIVAYSGIGRVQ